MLSKETIFVLAVLTAFAIVYSSMYLSAPGRRRRVGYVSTPIDPTDRELVCYMERYPDLKAAFNGDIDLARQHWYKIGALEGRIPHCPRNVKPSKMDVPPLTDAEAQQYLLTYTDLQRTYGRNNLQGARDHWQNFGFKEGRIAPQGWNSDLPSKMFLMGSRREGCKPDASDRLRCEGQVSSFNVQHQGDDVISLTASSTGNVCGDTSTGQGVVCKSTTVGPAERFTYQKIGLRKITLRSGLTQRYCRNNAGQVLCDSDDPSAFEYAMTSPPSAGNTNTRTKPFPPPTTWVPPPIPPPTPPPPPPPPASASTTTTTTSTSTTTTTTPTPPTPVVEEEEEELTTARDGAWWSFFFG